MSIPMSLQEAIDFFSEFYFGEHHIPGAKPKPYGNGGWYVNHDRGDLATYDFDQLTRLVIMAHDKCIRVSVMPVRQGIMKIIIFMRSGREGKMMERHPTLEEAMEAYRKKG